MIVLSIIIILWSIYMIITGDHIFGSLFLIAGFFSFWNNYKNNKKNNS